MKYLLLITTLCFSLSSIAQMTMEEAQQYTLDKQREIRQERLAMEKKKVEALAKQKKLLKMKQKREEMLKKFGRDSSQ